MGGKPRPPRKELTREAWERMSDDAAVVIERQATEVAGRSPLATFFGHPIYADSLSSEPVYWRAGVGWVKEPPEDV